MKALLKTSLLSFSFVALLTGCIHDHPVSQGFAPGKGEVPGTLHSEVDVYFDLSWENLLHNADFNSTTNTRDRGNKPHRFIIELEKDGEIIYHNTESLTQDDFLTGHMKHRISESLKAEKYHLAVWYDIQDEEGTYPFIADDLSRVTLDNHSTEENPGFQCAYTSDILDLSQYSKTGETIVKELELKPAGARFEIVATDVQQFIFDNKEALNQGDSFTAHVSFTSGAYSGLSLHAERLFLTDNILEYSGHIRLPFADYDELKIAEGFIFCNDEEDATAKFSITNSALFTVSQTDSFSFPVKRGFITTVRGDFMTNSIEGTFTIDHIWEGEIETDI